MVDPDIFQQITDMFGSPEIDLFVSRLNKHVARFVLWHTDPEAEAVDAFMLDWRHFHLMYAFPLFSIVGQRLLKLQEEAVARYILIALC